MDVRIVEAGRLEAEDVANWRAVQRGNPLFDSPFFSPDFAMAVGAARADAYVAIVCEQGEAMAYFPHHRLRGGVAKPIGGPISDYQGVIAPADYAFDPGALLAECGLSAFDFNHALIEQRALSDGLVARSGSPRINLSGGFDAYADARPKAGKHAIKETRRRIRKLGAEIGPVRFVYNDPDDAAWAWLMSVKNASFEKLKVASILDVAWVRRTLDRLRTIDHPDFGGALSTVYAGDRLVAAHFGMRSAKTWCWWFNTYDPALARYAPGLVMILLAAEEASRRGLTAIDFGRGEQHYKKVFANDETALCEGSVERPATRAGKLRRAQKAVLRVADRLPLGRYQSYPRRGLARFLTSMRLPAEAQSLAAFETRTGPSTRLERTKP